MTQLEMARKGIISPEMKIVAGQEQLDVEFIRAGIADGNIVIPANVNHKNFTPFGIGKGLRTKVNANLGRSTERSAEPEELRKLDVALKAGADFVMLGEYVWSDPRGPAAAVADVAAERTGRRADEFELRVAAGALMGVAFGLMLTELDASPRDLIALFDAGLEQLETGIKL